MNPRRSFFKFVNPFGLALTPNISLVLINRFSAFYGGERAIATYACVSYIICIVYLILQGVGDGSLSDEEKGIVIEKDCVFSS